MYNENVRSKKNRTLLLQKYCSLQSLYQSIAFDRYRSERRISFGNGVFARWNLVVVAEPKKVAPGQEVCLAST